MARGDGGDVRPCDRAAARLADRYVVEATLAIANGRPVPEDVAAAFAALPSTMASCEQRANTVDRAVIDLAEAVLLAGPRG